MPGPGDQSGPLTADQLRDIWLSAVDSGYASSIEAAGDGGGAEVYDQAWAQFERLSAAIDRSLQSLFILPFSGQTNPPASGPANATVTLTLMRTGLLPLALVLGAGLIVVDEDAVDASDSGAVAVDTGRRYALVETAVFFPGEQGPIQVLAQATLPGYGFNNPMPGTISAIEQPGVGFASDRATVTQTSGALPPAAQNPADRTTLTAFDEPDMFVPEHVGQYVLFTAGANEGLVGRATSFVPPDPTNAKGSGVVVEQLGVVTATNLVGGGFAQGERVEVFTSLFGSAVGAGVVADARIGPGGAYWVAFSITSGVVGSAGQVIVGSTSGGAWQIQAVIQQGTFATEAPSGIPLTGGASWRVLSWPDDWGLSSTNAANPTGGALGMLDLLGADRGLPRSNAESDDDYRKRVSQIADVVTPNAIKRALNRSLAGMPWCLREVGTALLPGMFYDRDDDPAGDFYDDQTIIFTGSGTYPSEFQEPVRYLRGVDVLAEGWWGSRVFSATTTFPLGTAPATMQTPSISTATGSSSQFAFTIRRGRFAIDTPVPTPAVGDKIVGLVSGSVWSPTGTATNPRLDGARWRCWLDYADFRAFFVVGVPKLGLGDFGIAYDAGADNAYDLGPPHLTFFDGFPIGDAQTYARVYAAIQATKAGGVGWDMYLSDGTCS